MRGASDNVRNFVVELKNVNAIIYPTHKLVLYIQELHAALFVDKRIEINYRTTTYVYVSMRLYVQYCEGFTNFIFHAARYSKNEINFKENR